MFQTDFRTAQIGWNKETTKPLDFLVIRGPGVSHYTEQPLHQIQQRPQHLRLGCIITESRITSMSFPYFLVKWELVLQKLYAKIIILNNKASRLFKLTFDPPYSNLNLNVLYSTSSKGLKYVSTFVLFSRWWGTTSLFEAMHTVVIEAVEAVLVGELEAVGRTR